MGVIGDTKIVWDCGNADEVVVPIWHEWTGQTMGQTAGGTTTTTWWYEADGVLETDEDEFLRVANVS